MTSIFLVMIPVVAKENCHSQQTPLHHVITMVQGSNFAVVFQMCFALQMERMAKFNAVIFLTILEKTLGEGLWGYTVS